MRSRAEPIFGGQQNSRGGKFIRIIGRALAEVKIGCMNLTYNLMRCRQLTKPKAATPALP